MILAAGRAGDSPLVFLGLSGENITRLIAGEPIRIPATRMRAMGMPAMEVIIHYGRTEETLLAELGEHGLLGERREA